MRIKAFAKINRTLEVYGLRPDGFHELRSVVVPIELADLLEVEETADCELATDSGYGERDLALRAAKELRRSCGEAGKRLGARMHIEKHVPVGGGLGGGSADAAAALRALNSVWRLNFPPERLAEIGAAAGSDVPALVLAQHYRAPVLMEGRGERVSVMATDAMDASRPIVLVSPGVSSSTAEVYARCSARLTPAVGAVNDLQAPACALHPEIAAALAALTASGVDDAMMSGSGSVVYGFADDEAAARAVAAKMRERGLASWVSRMVS